MTNEQIILNEAAKLDPATLHAIATAHHTPEQIAAIAAKATTTDDDGNEKPASVADVEIILAAQQLHTIAKWNSLKKRIRTGEKSLITCYLWTYTTKPSKEQREAAEAEGKEATPAPHYYPTKSYLFSCLQVEDSKPAPAGRFSSTAEIIAYNKKLAAERKAAKIDLDKLYTTGSNPCFPLPRQTTMKAKCLHSTGTITRRSAACAPCTGKSCLTCRKSGTTSPTICRTNTVHESPSFPTTISALITS